MCILQVNLRFGEKVLSIINIFKVYKYMQLNSFQWSCNELVFCVKHIHLKKHQVILASILQNIDITT